MSDFLKLLDQYLGSAAYFPYLLLGFGFVFTIYLKFPQIRFFSHAIAIVRGKHTSDKDQGDTTPFQALATALSGTVGTGNIAGVAFAVFMGGPAAIFWMWATAFLGMTTKFVEVTLSHKYRIKTEDGTMAGGPMYFMERKLNMKWLAVLFAIAMVISSFGAGNMPQINNIAASVESSFSIPPIMTGTVLAILLGLVIVGGIRRIAKVTEKIVPFMGVLYLVSAFAVIASNYENILPSISMIFSDVFTGTAATGGFLGASIAFAFSRGVNRGLFSNEAGQGSAAIAHASAKTDNPVAEGMVSILEPFIDTIIICTITGLVILSSGAWTQKFDNTFQRSDMVIVAGTYEEANTEHSESLRRYLSNEDGSNVKEFTGTLAIENGVLQTTGVTLLHSRSIAEDVIFKLAGKPFSGNISVKDGKLDGSKDVERALVVSGKSLLHSAPLTAKAFTFGVFGEYGQYVVTIVLLLFAFSTVIAWSYYGDRAMIYLFGAKSVMPYRLVYILAFFVASFTDTSIIWDLSAVTVVLTTLPNLLGLALLHKDMRDSVNSYWSSQKSNQ